MATDVRAWDKGECSIILKTIAIHTIYLQDQPLPNLSQQHLFETQLNSVHSNAIFIPKLI